MDENIKKIKHSLQSRTFIQDVFGYSLIKLGFADKYLSGLVTMYHSYSWLYKRFYDLPRISEMMPSQKVEVEKIWICWFQGLENAPDIVKKCVESVRYWNPDKEIIIITSENMNQYVRFPEYILKKWRQGIITNTHLSDLLRLELLITYGGLWVDATTYLTGPLPQYITRNDFFVYRNGWMDMEMINMGSWLMYAKTTNNSLLCMTRDLLYEYWKKYNYLKNYFLMHMFFKIATEKNPEEWNDIPVINHIDCHLLMNELTKKYIPERCEDILAITSVHKLTYKFSSNEKGITADFLDQIYRNSNTMDI